MARSSATTAVAFSRAAFLLSCAWIVFEHFGYQLDLGLGHNGENIPVKMDETALAFFFWEHFSHGFQHSQALVANDEFYAVQPTTSEPLKEIYPAVLVRFHALSSA